MPFWLRKLFPVCLCWFFCFFPVRVGLAADPPVTGEMENILVFWTDGSTLKAVTLMSVHPGQKPVGIVAIPIDTCIEADGGRMTIRELYQSEGRDGITAYLENKFNVPIENYVDISQSALERVSRALGPVVMNGRKTTMLDVFEGSYARERMDLQVEIRSLAARLIEPAVLARMPYLLWVLNSGIQTNMGAGNILSLYQTIRGDGPEILKKKALPGREYFIGPNKYREVSPEAWTRVLQEVTSI